MEHTARRKAQAVCQLLKMCCLHFSFAPGDIEPGGSQAAAIKMSHPPHTFLPTSANIPLRFYKHLPPKRPTI